MAYTVATAAMLGAFWACPNVAWMQWVLVAGVGFTLYGPQMLIGLCGAEVVPKASVSAANGMLGWISYLGALLPLSPCFVECCGSFSGAYMTCCIHHCGAEMLGPGNDLVQARRV